MSQLVEAVAETRAALVDSGTVTPADAAALHLAECYAAELDDADRQARHAAEVVAKLRLDDDPDARELIDALRGQLSRRQALDRLGDRLHRILADLNAVPKGRPVTVTPSAGSKLGKLRAIQGGASA